MPLNVSKCRWKNDTAWFKKAKRVIGSFYRELPPKCPLQERPATVSLRCLKAVSLSGVNVKRVVAEKSTCVWTSRPWMNGPFEKRTLWAHRISHSSLSASSFEIHQLPLVTVRTLFALLVRHRLTKWRLLSSGECTRLLQSGAWGGGGGGHEAGANHGPGPAADTYQRPDRRGDARPQRGAARRVRGRRLHANRHHLRAHHGSGQAQARHSTRAWHLPLPSVRQVRSTWKALFWHWN